MRIVGGRLRGRRLATPKSLSIRPTSDRNRESLFNILSHRWTHHLTGRVLDVFAGTGALGCEALSRGAVDCVFIENSPQGIALIRENIKTLDLVNCTTVLRRDATRPGVVEENMPVDLIFADPPYGKGLGEKAAMALAANGWIGDGALFILEERKGSLPSRLEGFALLDQRDEGDTSIGLFQRVAKP